MSKVDELLTGTKREKVFCRWTRVIKDHPWKKRIVSQFCLKEKHGKQSLPVWSMWWNCLRALQKRGNTKIRWWRKKKLGAKSTLPGSNPWGKWDLATYSARGNGRDKIIELGYQCNATKVTWLEMRYGPHVSAGWRTVEIFQSPKPGKTEIFLIV